MMEEEVDSLDHIKSLYNQSDQRRPNRVHDEPVYQISSNGENSNGHSASFGAGGRISQVIDPSFRAPTTNTNQSQLQPQIFGTIVPQASVQVTNTFSNVQREATSNVRECIGFLSNPIAPSISTTTTTNSNMSNQQPSSNPNINQNFQASVPFSSNSGTFYTSGYLSTNSMPSANSTTDFRSSNMSSIPSTAQATSVSSIPFLPSSEARSFSHLAKKHAGPSTTQYVSSSSNTVTSSTLHEYGPPVTLAAYQPPSQPQLSYLPANSSTRPMGPSEISSRVNDQAPTALHPSTSRINGNYQDSSKLSRPLGFTPAASRPLHVSCPPPPPPQRTSRTEESPLFSPPVPNAPPSPPLDHIPNSVRADNPIPQSLNTPSNSDPPSGKIPKIHKSTTVSDKYDDYSMLELIEKHDSLKSKLSFVERRRKDIEKSLNDMARTSQGKNVELDGTFRQRKDDQRRCHEELGELQSDIKKVSNKLLTKYNHRVADTQSNTSAPNPPPSRQRARMSTASSKHESHFVEPEKRISVKERERHLLNLTNSRIWCKLCDVHLDDFEEYCEHLHKRAHIMRMNPTHPWRRSKSSHDTRKTYDTLKSICAIVCNEIGNNSFCLAKYERSLNPHLEDKDKKLKSYFANRERGKFEEDDPLLGVKGYQNLIPISGFYCQLCDQAICDARAAEQHIKGYEHNFKHAKSVARDHMSEETFRLNQMKSYKKQNASQQQAQKEALEQQPQKNSTSTSLVTTAVASSSSNSTTKSLGQKLPRAHALPIAQYKKPTSHIVDNHEAIVDKFTNRPLSADQGAKSTASSSKSKNHALLARVIIESDSEELHQDRTTIGDLDYGEDDEECVRRTVRKADSPRKKKLFKRNTMPEILPIQDSRSKPSALKRLKSTSERARLNKEKPYFSSSESEASDDNDPQILAEIHLNKGDPDSPFPGLDLVVTGNVHSAVLKDPRLAKDGKVLMNRINMDDYKDLMMDSTTLWTRINHLMTKKEPAQLERIQTNLRQKVSTKPTFFEPDGELVPVNTGGDGSETDIDEEDTIEGTLDKPHGDIERPLKKIKGADSVSTDEDFCDALNSISKSSKKDKDFEGGTKKNVSEHEKRVVNSENDQDDDEEAERDKLSKEIDAAFEDDKVDGGEDFSMHLLEDFFCEKPK